MINVPNDIKLNEPSDNICKMSAELLTSVNPGNTARLATNTAREQLSLSHVCFTFSTERQFSGGHFHLCGQTGQTDPISETNDGVILTLKSRFEATLTAERCRGTFRHIDLKIRLLGDGKSHKALPSRVHWVILILDDNKRQEEN